MQTPKTLNDSFLSKDPRTQWEEVRTEKKSYLKRLAEQKESEVRMSDYFRHQFDNDEGDGFA